MRCITKWRRQNVQLRALVESSDSDENPGPSNENDNPGLSFADSPTDIQTQEHSDTGEDEYRDDRHPLDSDGEIYELNPANTEEELKALEDRLEDVNEGAELSKHLKRLGEVDAADHVKKSMAAFVIVAPARLRLGMKLNILLEAHSLSKPITVTVSVYTYPREYVLTQDSAILNSENSYSALKTIEINPKPLLLETEKYKSVKLVAQFGSFHKAEKFIMLSFSSGYIFIQTDKPVYNPGDTVHYRAFVSNPEFQAFNSTISLEIQNPDGIVMHSRAKVSASNGILSESYTLYTVVKEGTWKVVANFDNVKENRYSTVFVVKKCVLSPFKVTLTPKKSYLSLDEEKLEVEVTARYLYGEPVKGVAYVVFGIEINGEKKRITSMKQMNDLNGKTVNLTMEEIKKAYPDTSRLLGSSVYVKASVMTSSGSDTVEAMKSGIKIVMSPYVLSIRDTPKYFKPGLPLDIVVTVSHQDGSPAPNIPVEINFLQKTISTHSGTIRVSVNMSDEVKTHILKVKTALPGVNAEKKFSEEMPLEPYFCSYGLFKNYLHISVGSNKVAVGNSLIIKVYIKTASPEHREVVKQLTYTVLNKGKIITAARVNVECLDVVNIPLLVTTEMLPSFRLVAYYMLPWQLNAEVVADSVFVDVEDQCVASLSLGPVAGEKLSSYSPGRSIKFEVKGDTGANVSLVAVDNAIFLLNKNHLTQKKVWEVVGQSDMGCTAGGGRNNMGVFSDAGLVFYSSKGERTDFGSEKAYSEKFLQRCCVDGMREIPMPYSCNRRSLYITEDRSCVSAFLRCCKEYSRERTTTEKGSGPVAVQSAVRRAEKILDLNLIEDDLGEDDLSDLENIYVHTKFFESWMWTDIRLPSVTKPDGLAVYPVNTTLPDSITQWGFLAISASPQTGFCVSEPYNIRAWKPFSIDLWLPRSVSRNELVEIKVVIHNYRNETLKVMVILEKTKDMCSVAFSNAHRQQVSVPAGSFKLISYTIIPLKTGELPLQITAFPHSSIEAATVRKHLRVVIEGIRTIKSRSFVLNPSKTGDITGRQVIKVEKMELKSVVPNSKPTAFINVRGDLLADIIYNSIKEDSLVALIRMPGGCVEQNLARISLLLIATHYLDRSGNWDAVGIDRRQEAIRYIQTGYTNQLNYQKKDGSYPPYEKEGTSTWITAYVVKVFSITKLFININEKHLCGPLVYLLKNKQRPDGSFQEDNPVYDTSMMGGLRGSESRVSLTAFVLIALAEAQNAVTCQEPGLNIQCISSKAADYLRENFLRLKRPYTVAIACYALAVSNHGCMKSMLLKFASPDRTHWTDSYNRFFTLEATGYALLALIKEGHMKEAGAPFQWLNEQRDIGGGYGSTQSTMVVLQALSEYLIKRPPPYNYTLRVELHVPGDRITTWNFLPKMAHKLQTAKVPFDKEFKVVATGNGKGILKVVTVYHELPDVYENSTCNGFQLDVSIAKTNGNPRPDVEMSYKLNIRVRALEGEQRMVILDIGLPTGFEPENSDLEQLMNPVDRYINNFQVVNLSDRGSLIIHLFKVSSTETDVISFRLHQKFIVGLLQPSTVTVYQYYNKDKRCSRFYSPPEIQLENICKNNVCRCSQGNCCVRKPENLSFGKQRLKLAACEGRHYVYKVKLISVKKCHYDQYEMKIVQIIQKGSEAGLKKNDKRMFLSHASCRRGLGLREGQDYLIIGRTADVSQAGSTTNMYLYMLGKDTWVERWPAESECVRGSALKVKCAELKSFPAALTKSCRQI
ncbi:complement C3-like [Carassius carassius]|uniref:complement C3-like n=1 Tax=Carassius carassius TaxID=217509 RepID=UPI00286853E0|nr:complement C3-like [Carassius carassius]